MKKFFLKLLLFALIGTGLLLALKIIAGRAGNVYKDGAAIVCEHKRLLVRKGLVKYAPGKTNIIFMGNSKILAGLVPDTFDKLSGGKTYSYNLALNYFIPARIYSQETVKYLLYSTLRRSNIRATIARNRTIISQTDAERGYYYITDQALYPGGRLPDSYGRGTLSLKKRENFSPYIDPYVKMFFDLCKSTRITVLLIEPPLLNNELES